MYGITSSGARFLPATEQKLCFPGKKWKYFIFGVMIQYIDRIFYLLSAGVVMRKKPVSWVRRAILIFFILFITFEAYLHQVKGGGPEGSPSIHALCPFGGLESLLTFLTTGNLLDKIYIGTLALFVVSVILAIVLRRSFCGWICPLGGLQEFFGLAGKKIVRKKFSIPAAADRYLRFLKYIVLLLILVMSWRTASLWFAPYDPWAAYGHISEGLPAVWKEFTVGFIILIISFVGSFFYDRFFCKYLCPMGACLGLVSLISPFRIKREESVCINCNRCTKICPVNIEVSKIRSVTSPECINCQECIGVCPKEGALVNEYTFAKGKKIKPLFTGIAALVIFFSGIGIASLTGNYNLLPPELSAAEGALDVDSLKGYMTLQEISNGIAMPLDEVYRRLGIPESVPSDIKVKDLSQYIDGFDFHEAQDKLK
jgi:NapH/MauN family ferredoxin-type protein